MTDEKDIQAALKFVADIDTGYVNPAMSMVQVFKTLAAAVRALQAERDKLKNENPSLYDSCGEDKMKGSDISTVEIGGTAGCTVTLCCISEEARTLLDRIMEEWEGHYKKLKESFPKNEPGYYGFAYWLVRYSGLIEPAGMI